MRVPFADPLFGLELHKLALPLFGRAREMQCLQSVLENASRESVRGPRAVIVSGEIGVGKSRILEELCSMAVSQDCMVLRASAYESGRTFPYLPFIEALRPLVRSTPTEVLRRYTGLDCGPHKSLAADLSLFGQPLVSALCQLFPELAYRLQSEPGQEILSAEQHKFRLFDAIATFLEGVAEQQPVLVCIDNMQWADSATLELTIYLTVRLHSSRIVLAGATRPSPAPSQDDPSSRQASKALKLLSELIQQELLFFLPLAPLDEDAARQHIHALLPDVVQEELVQQLFIQAGGNPFFVEELVRSLCLNRQLTLQAGVWQLTRSMQGNLWPERITLAVSERLQGLACRELLQIAALCGRAFPLHPLIQVSELAEERARALIDEALHAMLIARVLTPATNGSGTVASLSEQGIHAPSYMFCQGIVQEVLAAEVPVQRVRQLHGALGAALEAYYGLLASTHAAELAYQYALSDRHEATLVWSLRAGAEAIRKHAHRETLSHLHTALQLLEGGVQLPAEQQWPSRSQIYLILGESWLKLGELELAANTFHQALDSHEAVMQAPFIPAKAHRFLADTYRLQGKFELAMAHLQAATTLLAQEQEQHAPREPALALITWPYGEDGSRQSRQDMSKKNGEDFIHLQRGERLLLFQAKAMIDILLLHFTEAEAALWQVHQLATELSDRGSQGFALHILGWLRGWGKEIGEAIRLITQAHELYIAIGDPFHAALGDQSLGIIYQALGEMEKARHYNLQGFERARRYGMQHILGWLHCNQGVMMLALGTWEESELQFRSALAAAEQPGNARIKPLATQGLAMLAFRRGDWPEAEQLFQEAVQAAMNTEWYPGALALYGHFLAVTGCRATARIQLDRAAALAEPFGYSGDFYMPFLAEGYLHLEDRQLAIAYIERIRDLRGFLYYGVSVARILGEVAALQEDWDAAEQAFADGLALCRRSHNEAEEAAILYEQARALLMRSRTSRYKENDPAQESIYTLCAQARSIFSQYGIQRAVRMVDTLQDGLRQLTDQHHRQQGTASATSSHLLHADYQLDLHLTRRELEVLCLVAEGRTDREVASTLVLSPRTVNRHLSNIFVKLDVPGRAAAVAYAIRLGLVK